MIMNHLIAMTAAVVIDRIVGDPERLPHPVRLIGALITRLEQRWNQGTRRKIKGALFVVLIVGIVFTLGLLITLAAYALHIVVGIIVEAFVIATTIAAKGLADAAGDVYNPLKNGDLDDARKKLSLIVGRDTDGLAEEGIIRATVETVAENTSDGVTAPLFWAFIGGAPLAIVYRAVNTCDSMVGYKSDRYFDFGWAAAKMDDLLNYVPSRLTGLLMIVANRANAAQTKMHCFRLLFRDARNHPSPNSGWGEAAAAALLGVQLGGVSTYQGVVSERTVIGDALIPLSSQHILQSVHIMKRTVTASLLLYWIGGSLLAITAAWF